MNRIGLLIRTHGGAIFKNKVPRELAISEKLATGQHLKKKIGLAAAKLVKENDKIILDSGTTAAEIALNLINSKSLVVMTNGIYQ